MSRLATTTCCLLAPARPMRIPLQKRRAAPLAAPFSVGACSRRAVAPATSAAPDSAAPAPLHQSLAAAAVGCLAAALLVVAPAAEAKDAVEGFPKVVDGDTLDFSGTRVRLFGIDAPETKQSCTASKGGDYLCGERSKEALLQKIGRGKVVCEQKNRDMYGRIVGICSLNGEDLNGWMVEQGLAVAYRQYSKAYVPLEDAARAANKGIWSGSFEVPAQWRKDHPRGGNGSAAPAATSVANTAAAAAAAVPSAASAAVVAGSQGAPPPPGCPIKGNINSKGEKIYHVPGGAFYDRTVIELDQGERYFCSVKEAEAAGWRASAK